MAENTINELLEFYSNLKCDGKNTKDIEASKDVEDSFDSVEQIGRIAYDSEDIQRHRYINIGTILKNAIQHFLPQKNVGANVYVDPDWMARFLDCAKDVSDDEMRLIWSRVLSGELNKPNSISVMTLETLRNMSKHDAEIFHKLASFTVIDDDGGDPFIPNNGFWSDGQFKSDKDYGINYDELLWMQELRLVNLNAGLVMRFDKDDKDARIETILKCGNLSIKMTSDLMVQISCYGYTRIGAQLLSLIEDISPNEGFFEDRIKNRYSSESTKIEINTSDI